MSDTADVPEEACLSTWCAGDDWCAVTCAMDVLDRKWHPVVVHCLLESGPLRFSELGEAIGPVTNKMLSESLEDLERRGLVDRTVVGDRPVAVEYSLTDRGRSLEPVIDALETWGRTYLRSAGATDAEPEADANVDGDADEDVTC